jgi:hypothetical protein
MTPTGSEFLVAKKGVWTNIPPKCNRNSCFSPYLYRTRNLIERFLKRAAPRQPEVSEREREKTPQTSPHGATVTCAHFSCKQLALFCCGRRLGRSTASGSSSLAPSQRLHPNVLAAALANKVARIAWSVLAPARYISPA